MPTPAETCAPGEDGCVNDYLSYLIVYRDPDSGDVHEFFLANRNRINESVGTTGYPVDASGVPVWEISPLVDGNYGEAIANARYLIWDALGRRPYGYWTMVEWSALKRREWVLSPL